MSNSILRIVVTVLSTLVIGVPLHIVAFWAMARLLSEQPKPHIVQRGSSLNWTLFACGFFFLAITLFFTIVTAPTRTPIHFIPLFMFGAFGLLLGIQAAIGWRWRIYYEDDGFTYRPVLGRKQYAPYASLTHVIYGKYFLYLYAGTRRFTVERGTLGIRKFDAVLQQKCGLKLIEEYNIGRVKKSGVNIFLGIVCCLAALTVTFVCIAYGKPWFVVLVTSLLGLPGYYMVWAATIWKITYDETQFTYTNIAGKTVTVPFATICKISHIGSHVLIRSSQYKHSFIIKRSADGYQPFMRYIYQLKRRKAKLISGAAGKNLQRE